MPLRAVAVTFTACALCAGAAAAPRSSTQKLDVELAVDTTGSMGPSIRRIQRDAEKLVGGIEARVPGARVAVVQFKDAGDTPEYELVQPLTLSAKAVAAAVGRLSAGGGGDNPEAYNVVFRNSYADRAVGWRSGARKVVVVVGDAEPHGAGARSAHLYGCLDASTDPHHLSSGRELAAMKKAGRTLIMIRQAGTASAALACYQSLAAAAVAGGAARDGGDLAGLIVNLVGRAAGVAAPPPAAAKPAGGTTRPKPSEPDRTPPHVVALKSGGPPGTSIKLVYRVTDDSGRSSDRVAVYAGSGVLTQSGWTSFAAANGTAYFFSFPASSRLSGTYRFCVQSRDPSGNVSKPSCAPLIVG